MSRSAFGALPLLGSALLLAMGDPAFAQWYPAANPCACTEPVARVALQPVPQTCYRTVPVTEYQQVRQMVKRPVVETQYVEEPVTEYQQVVETRSATVPTVEYQDVVECQTVTRDYGRWTTRYHENPRVTPCEYDGRPSLLGALNRASYSIRSTFKPRYTTSREYVPNVVTQDIPVTRRVAIQGTKEVTYNVARMVPVQSRRKVAVNTVRYVDEEVTSLQPVTVMRTVPIGTRVAYAAVPLTSGRVMALQPTADPISSARAPSPKQTADSRNSRYDEAESNSSNPQQFQRTTPSDEDHEIRGVSPSGASLDQPSNSYDLPLRRTGSPSPAGRQIATTPLSVVRVNQWVARSRTPAQPDSSNAPVSVAKADQ